MPYTSASAIANYLGVVLTAGQQAQADVVAAAVTSWIDEYKGRSWQASSPVSGEVHTVSGDRLFLDHKPVTAITSVETRSTAIGAAWTTLPAGSYELLDPIAGVLQLAGWGNFLARVAYTHSGATAPAHIALAATIIAASMLGPTLRPNTQGLDSIAVGQNDINIKFAPDYADIPTEALNLLGGAAVVIA